MKVYRFHGFALLNGAPVIDEAIYTFIMIDMDFPGQKKEEEPFKTFQFIEIYSYEHCTPSPTK